MINCFYTCAVVALLVLVSGDNDYVSYLNQNFSKLVKCVEDHDSLNIFQSDTNPGSK